MFALVAAVLVAVSASAGHWPMHGGDSGHSGYQPVDPTGPPVDSVYFRDEAVTIRTSVLTTEGSQTVYSTTDGMVHHRNLSDGGTHRFARVLDEFFNGIDSDIFGNGREQIAPADSSTASKPVAFTFQLFNEDAILPADSDVGISVFDQSTGNRILFTRVAGLADHSANSSPILFQGALWFIATPDNPVEPDASPETSPKLVKVPVIDPAGVEGNPQLGTPVIREVPSASGVTSPTGVFLRNAENEPQPYVLVAFTSANSVRAFSADNPTVAGPQSGDLGGEAFTPSSPVRPSGRIPQPGEAVTTAPYIYVATEETDPQTDYPAGGGQVHKLKQKADAPMSLVLADGESNRTEKVPGNPSPTPLSLTQEVRSPETSGGRIVFATSCDVYSINANDMTDVEELLGPSAPDGCADDDTSTQQNLPLGFGRTTAALSGNLGFIQRNDGTQLAFFIDVMEPLSVPAEFDSFSSQDPAPAPAATNAWGQPAISQRFIQFADDKRLSVYRAAQPVPPGEAGSRFSVNDVTVTEGNGGEQQATFTVARTGSLAGAVTVSTADNTATAGQDYAAIASQVVTFEADETSKTITVAIVGDTTDEPDETFFVRLSNPSGAGATLGDAEGLGLITDDDATPPPPAALPNVAISDVSVLEGSVATFDVSLSNPSTDTVTMDFETADDTAKAGVDYTPQRGSLTFEPGQTTKTIAVPLLSDRADDPNERFFIGVMNIKGATSADPVGSALIGNVQPDRLKARGFSAKTTPTRDRTRPFRFTTSGKMLVPVGLTRAEACNGSVAIRVKAVRKTISNRRAKMRSNCTFRRTVTFRNRSRFGKVGKLKFVARFLGNGDVIRSAARTQFVRTR